MKILLPTLFLLFVQTVFVFAQALPMLPSDPAQAPVDGGLLYAAAAGTAYAWRKLRRSPR